MISPTELDAFIGDSYPALAGSGLRCVEVAEGEMKVVWAHDETQPRPGGCISGPTQFALADTGLWYVDFTHIGLEEMAVTADLHIAFSARAVEATSTPAPGRFRWGVPASGEPSTWGSAKIAGD